MSRPQRRKRTWVAGLALVLLALATGCGGIEQQPAGRQQEPPVAGASDPGPSRNQEQGSGESEDEVKPFPGYRAPSFTATDVFSGEKVSLEDLRGQVVFLNFWATWCPPCKAEMPDMETLRQEMGDRVRIVALGVDPREPAEKLAAFAEAMGLTFTIAHDGGKAARAYQVVGVPTSIFIDKAGIVRARYSWALDLELMKEAVALAEKGDGVQQE